ncbi:MAG: DUF3169 family protein [Clostridiales bacterium]|nr:DUF3169 family protein [Clostridiales bacterium]
MKNKDRVQQENRKALPKFLLILAGSVAVGLLFAGVIIATWETGTDYTLQDILYEAMGMVSPWLTGAVTVVCMPVALYYYFHGKRRWESWDGEEEDVLDHAEHELSLGLIINSVNMVLTMLFYGMTCTLWYSWMGFLAAMVGLIVSLAVLVVYQQKAVDLCKRMNPEKRGSVYDVNFQKKWLDSCDEAERTNIYRSSYRAYRNMSITLPVLWCVAVVAGLWFDGVGPLAVVLVSAAWLVQTLSYGLESLRLEAPKKPTKE